jgi:hypothetical protein
MMVVNILNRLAASNLNAHFRLVGTHALYAYESAMRKKNTAVNNDGFEVDINRRPAVLDAQPFSAIVIATNGDMARMNTFSPAAFVHFKLWMSQLPERDPGKRRRDALQAKAVDYVLREYLPHLA